MVVLMKISARNALVGTVIQVTKGAVDAEVGITLKNGEKIVAIITIGSVDTLGLREGKSAYAVVKASDVMIGKDVDPKRISARNVLPGTLAKVTAGAVNAEVTLRLSGGTEITSIITNESSRSLGLKEGDPACAVFKASNVMVGID
jgi:molybdate transport system regulatory protein